jgi:hypothetical protein
MLSLMAFLCPCCLQAAALSVKLQLLAARVEEAMPALLPRLAALAPALQAAAAQLHAFLPLCREAGAAMAAAQAAHEQAQQQQVPLGSFWLLNCPVTACTSCPCRCLPLVSLQVNTRA